eukprot:3068888-Prymnesium_polylepis.1
MATDQIWQPTKYGNRPNQIWQLEKYVLRPFATLADRLHAIDRIMAAAQAFKTNPAVVAGCLGALAHTHAQHIVFRPCTLRCA